MAVFAGMDIPDWVFAVKVFHAAMSAVKYVNVTFIINNHGRLAMAIYLFRGVFA